VCSQDSGDGSGLGGLHAVVDDPHDRVHAQCVRNRGRTVSMAPLVDWLTEHMVVGMLVMTRLSFLLAAMPAIGVGVPRRVKALLALMMTALLLPTIAERPAMQNLPDLEHVIDL